MDFRLVLLQVRIRSSLFGLQICVFYLKLPQGLYKMCAKSQSSGEIALMGRLNSAFAGRLCDMYLFLMCWLKYVNFSGSLSDLKAFKHTSSRKNQNQIK